jgi:hypothetical protein
MEYFVNTPGPQASAKCSDNACPCSPSVEFARGEGYLYVSPEAVDFRRDARTLADAQTKMERMAGQLDAFVVMDPIAWSGLMICEEAAKCRRLDLAWASADAKEWWETGRMPLRPSLLFNIHRPGPDSILLKSTSEILRSVDVGKAMRARAFVDQALEHAAQDRIEQGAGSPFLPLYVALTGVLSRRRSVVPSHDQHLAAVAEEVKHRCGVLDERAMLLARQADEAALTKEHTSALPQGTIETLLGGPLSPTRETAIPVIRAAIMMKMCGLKPLACRALDEEYQALCKPRVTSHKWWQFWK